MIPIPGAVWRYAFAMIIGASSAWYVQGLRWDRDSNARDADSAFAIKSSIEAINIKLIESNAQTEAIRAEFHKYKIGKENEISTLERAVANGTKRLRIKATCIPPVRPDGSVPGGTGGGTAELEYSARLDYFRLKRGIDEQFALLQLCRSELRKRSG